MFHVKSVIRTGGQRYVLRGLYFCLPVQVMFTCVFPDILDCTIIMSKYQSFSSCLVVIIAVCMYLCPLISKVVLQLGALAWFGLSTPQVSSLKITGTHIPIISFPSPFTSASGGSYVSLFCSHLCNYFDKAKLLYHFK